MFVSSGAQGILLAAERDRFIAEEWPRVFATIRRLGLSLEQLMAAPAVARTQSAVQGE
jgi:GntR family transcriptional regulator